MAFNYAIFGLFLSFIYGTFGQTCYGRVRQVPSGVSVGGAPPAAFVGPAAVVTPQFVASAPPPPDDYASLLQLVSLLGQAAPPPPPPARLDATVNSGNIIDKLIDALILTATQNTKPKSSGTLIDISLLQALAKSQKPESAGSVLSGGGDSGPSLLVEGLVGGVL